MSIFTQLVGTMSDAQRALYSGNAGNGKGPSSYTRGSGADAITFVFAVQDACAENAPLTRAQVETLQVDAVTMGKWPGRARGAASPALASMQGRAIIEHVGGAFRLTPKGRSMAALMLAEMGYAAPEKAPAAPEKAPAAPEKAPAAPVETAEVAIVEQPQEPETVVNVETARETLANEGYDMGADSTPEGAANALADVARLSTAEEAPVEAPADAAEEFSLADVVEAPAAPVKKAPRVKRRK